MQQTTNVTDSIHNLENAGMNRLQAEAVTKLVRDSVTEALEPVVRNMAARTEVTELNAQFLEIKAEMADLSATYAPRLRTAIQ